MKTSYNISHLYQAGIYQRTSPFPQRLSGFQLKRYLWISNACWAAGLGLALVLIYQLVGVYRAQTAANDAVAERGRTLEMEINRLAQLHSYNADQTLALARSIQAVLDTTSGKRRDFMEKVLPEALRIQALYRIPASATIGMACYESAFGQSDLARQHNNFFGIKAFNDWDGEKALMSTRDLGVATQANFRVYSDLERGIEGYALFLYGRDRYKAAFQHRDGRSFVQAVAKAGYCPDSNYTMAVCSIIERHHLDVLDLPDRLPDLHLPTLQGLATATELPFGQESGAIPSILRRPVLPTHTN